MSLTMPRLKQIAGFIIICVIAQLSSAQRLPSSDPRDCLGSILICGNTDIGITPTNAGRDEFAEPGNPVPSCFNFNAPQAWFKVEIATTGTFTFEINPDDGVADYDFAVFGPTTDCSNLGAAIRCSSTNPQAAGVSAATGLNSTSTDTEEGCCADGDGFLRQLDVTAGETYYIIVGLAVGSGGFSINTGGTTTFPQAAIATDVDDLQECDDDDGARDGFKDFDFSTRDADILNGQNNAVVTYHRSLNDANIGSRPLSFPFTNTSNPQEIFYRVERTDSECADFNSFMVTVDDSQIDTTADPVIVCSTNTTEIFDIDTIIDELVPNNSSFDITYHDSQADAQNEINSRSSVYTVTTTTTNAFIKVIDPMNQVCDAIIIVPLLLGNPPAITTPPDFEICDDDFDGQVTTGLTSQDDLILNGLNPSEYNVRYYKSITDRNAGTSAIGNFTNDSNPQQLFARVTRTATGCTADVDFPFIVNPKPVLAPQPDVIFCLDQIDPLVLTVESGFDFYEWSTGQAGAALNSIEVMAPGDYTVTVSNSLGCETSLTIIVNPSDIAIIDNIDIIDFQRGNNSVIINVSGPGDYEFAIDDGPFQDSPEFTALDSGFHDFRVRDKNGCGTFRSQFGILDFQPFFTPNGDGFNDLWTLDALTEYPEARLLIYDRYGKLLKQITPSSPGWDGTFNGELLPSSTYWYTVEIPDRPIVRGYFAMKR